MPHYAIVIVVLAFLAGAPGKALAEENPVEPAVGTPSVSLVSSDGNVIDVLEFKDIDIKDALRVIAQKSGLNIVAGPEVQGRITIRLNQIEAREALKTILQSQGLTYAEDSGIIRVLPAGAASESFPPGNRKPRLIPILYADIHEVAERLDSLKGEQGKVIINDSSKTLVLLDSPDRVAAMEEYIHTVDVPLETREFPLRHVSPEKIQDKVRLLLSSEIGKLQTDPASNRLIVSDTPLKIQEISALVDRLDQKTEISLNYRLVRIRLNEEHLEGIDWEAIVSDYQNLRSADLLNSQVLKDKPVSIGVVTNDDFAVLLDALDTVGAVEVVMDSSQKVSLEEKAEISFSPGAGNSSSGDLPIVLALKPVLQQDKTLRFSLDWPQLSPFAKETAIRLNGHETIVIGGVMTEQEVETTSKIPLLGNLPIFGFAFRYKDKLVQRSEYVIFITPQIVANALVRQ